MTSLYSASILQHNNSLYGVCESPISAYLVKAGFSDVIRAMTTKCQIEAYPSVLSYPNYNNSFARNEIFCWIWFTLKYEGSHALMDLSLSWLAEEEKWPVYIVTTPTRESRHKDDAKFQDEQLRLNLQINDFVVDL